MNRRALERYLRAHGCIFHHSGGRHDIWINAATLASAPIPRHNELKRNTARSICRMLGVPLPPGL
jgi:HicA toxin of bacterial toxin-antitoxin,